MSNRVVADTIQEFLFFSADFFLTRVTRTKTVINVHIHSMYKVSYHIVR